MLITLQIVRSYKFSLESRRGDAFIFEKCENLKSTVEIRLRNVCHDYDQSLFFFTKDLLKLAARFFSFAISLIFDEISGFSKLINPGVNSSIK